MTSDLVVCLNCDTTVAPLQFHGQPTPQCPLCGAEFKHVRSPNPPRPRARPAPDATPEIIERRVGPGSIDSLNTVDVRRYRGIVIARRAQAHLSAVTGQAIDMEKVFMVKVPYWHLVELLDSWEKGR